MNKLSLASLLLLLSLSAEYMKAYGNYTVKNETPWNVIVDLEYTGCKADENNWLAPKGQSALDTYRRNAGWCCIKKIKAVVVQLIEDPSAKRLKGQGNPVVEQRSAPIYWTFEAFTASCNDTTFTITGGANGPWKILRQSEV